MPPIGEEANNMQSLNKELMKQVMMVSNEILSSYSSVRISKLRDILYESRESNCCKDICQVIWDCNVFNLLINVIKENFSKRPDSWNAKIILIDILCLFVEDFVPRDQLVLEIYEQQLEYALLSILTSIELLYSDYGKFGEKDSAYIKELLYYLSKTVIIITTKYPVMILSIYQSDIFFKLLSLDNNGYIIAIKLIMHFLNIESKYFMAHNDNFKKYLYKIVYQLSFQDNIESARFTVKLLLKWIVIDPSLAVLLTSNFAFVSVLDKWYGNGFDENLMQLKRYLKFYNDKYTLNSQECYNAAVVIQRVYRRYQNYKYKQYTNDHILDKNLKCKQQFRKSLLKHLEEIQSISADQVNRYMKQRQNNAATKIQATWRGYAFRKKMHIICQQTKENRSVLISQEARKWLDKCGRISYTRKFDSLNWNFLESSVSKWMEKYPAKKPANQEECNQQFQVCKEMIQDFYRNHTKRFNRKQHIDILLKKIDSNMAFFSTPLSLHDIAHQEVNLFINTSSPIITAKTEHKKQMKKLQYSQWEQLTETEESMESD